MADVCSVAQKALTFSINSALVEVGPAVDRIVRYCRDNFIDKKTLEEIAQKIELATTEAITNIVKHAYGLANDGPIHISVIPENGKITITLRDLGIELHGGIEGRGLSFDFDTEFNALPENGMGWFIIKSDMDVVEYTRLGSINQLVLVKYI